MVLPAPVGPTIATVWPGSTFSDRPSMSGLSRVVAEGDVLQRDPAAQLLPDAPGPSARADCSSASRSSKTRSAEATPDWIRFAMLATCVSGWLNCREYCTNACTSPMDSAPEATRRPPTTATST